VEAYFTRREEEGWRKGRNLGTRRGKKMVVGLHKADG
jgi:hypothetical protein